MTTQPDEQIPYSQLIPRPDPTKLTDEAISRATSQYRRELDSMRSLLAERIQAEIEARDKAVQGLRDVWASLHEVLSHRITEQGTALDRHLAHVDEITDRIRAGHHADLASLREILETRLTAMDTATELVARDMQRVPSVMEERVTGLRELLGERITAIDEVTELLARSVPADIDKAARALREVLQGEIRNVSDVAVEKFLAIDGTFSSNALALTAALAAQKEAAAEQNKSNTLAITKSEVATKEKIDSNALQTATSLKSLADRLDDLKERVDRGEGSTSGAQGSRAETRAEHSESRLTMSAAIAAIAVVVAMISTILYVVKK